MRAGTIALPAISRDLVTPSSRGADYTATGGLRGAVHQSAEDLYAGLSPSERDLARRIFLRLPHVEGDAPLTRRRVTRQEVTGLESTAAAANAGSGDGAPGEVQRVLDRFVTARRVTAGAGTFELSHEALLGPVTCSRR